MIDEFEFVPNEYDTLILKTVKDLGGFYNAHSHLDRASTLDKRYLKTVGIDPIEGASLPLRVKQNLTGEFHKGPAYETDDLKNRIRNNLEQQYNMLTTTVVSMIDATSDIGLSAINIANDVKKEIENKITFKIGAHPIFGFKEEERWEIYQKAAEKCDILGGLPEKDDKSTSIGYKQHLKRILLLGQKLHKSVHIHVDQRNDPEENGTETLTRAIDWIGAPEIEGVDEPTVWAIHSISPSCYSEKRFNRLIDSLLKHNIGIIVCPSAAISMRQLRPINTPIHNSIARVLEMLEAGVHIKLGTDNIGDVFVPSSDGCMLTEVKLLSHAIRFYIINVLAKLAAGKKLNRMDQEMVRRSLGADLEVFRLYEN